MLSLTSAFNCMPGLVLHYANKLFDLIGFDMYVSTYVCTYVHTYIHTCRYIHTYIHTYIYIHTYKLKKVKEIASVVMLFHTLNLVATYLAIYRAKFKYNLLCI